MFRLLIVSERKPVEAMFASMEGWESMGYRPPRVRTTSEDALLCMQKHHIDAIAVDDNPAFDDLRAHLARNCPDMPFFRIEDSAEKELCIVKEVAQVLDLIHADHSNDDYDESFYFNLERDLWLRRVLSGEEPTEDSLRRKYDLYRCRIPLDQPCVFARLSLPEGDAYLSGPWHYGTERLETALYNFFGLEHEHMLIRIAVVTQHEARVLVAPAPDTPTGADMSFQQARAYLEDTIAQVKHYLGLSMELQEFRAVDSLTAFAAEHHNI